MNKSLILIIEHDESRIRDISDALGDYTIFVVSTGKEALTMYEKNHLKIRLVLLQLVLPDMSGVALLRQLKQICSLPEMIVLSVHKSTQLVVNVMKEGAVDYLLIPLNLGKLFASVERAMSCLDCSKAMCFFPAAIDKALPVFEEMRFQRNQIEKSICMNTIMDILSVSGRQIPIESTLFCGQFFQKVDKLFSELPIPTVLVVDNDEHYLTKMTRFLSDKYDLYKATSGVEALRLIEALPQLDVILVDIFLKDCVGTVLIRQMKMLCPKVEIIAVAVFDLLDKVVLSFQEGASDYLNKPINKSIVEDEFLQSIERVLVKKYSCQYLIDFSMQFMGCHLSTVSKCKILDELYEVKREKGDVMLMRDIYMFFPDIRSSGIPQEVALPSQLFQEGIRVFIQRFQGTRK